MKVRQISLFLLFLKKLGPANQTGLARGNEEAQKLTSTFVLFLFLRAGATKTRPAIINYYPICLCGERSHGPEEDAPVDVAPYLRVAISHQRKQPGGQLLLVESLENVGSALARLLLRPAEVAA